MKKLVKYIIPILCIFLFACTADYSNTTSNIGSGSASFYDYDKELEEAVEEYVDLDSYNKEDNTFNRKKIIYSGEAVLETKNYKEQLVQLEKLISDNNIMVSSSSEEDYDNYWFTSHNKYHGTYGKIKRWTLRVPIENFNSFVNSLDDTTAHITSKNIYSNDVTKQYTDNETKIKSLEIQRDRLLELLEKAENVNEILEIEDRLTDVRYELEGLTNKNLNIDYNVQYSEFNLTLKEVNRYSTDTYSFLERFVDSFGESWANFTEWLGDFIIWCIFALPFIGLLGLVLFIINLVRKARGKEKISIVKTVKNIVNDGKVGGFFKFLLLIAIVIIIYIILSGIF